MANQEELTKPTPYEIAFAQTTELLVQDYTPVTPYNIVPRLNKVLEHGVNEGKDTIEALTIVETLGRVCVAQARYHNDSSEDVGRLTGVVAAYEALKDARIKRQSRE
jgi:hypothetical protein